MRRERIAHYRIEGLLGAGGMGEVWSAFDEKLERRVAIKTLPEDRASDDARGRMLREARAAGALHHPGIVPIYDTGEIDGVSYIVMEWVEGETLAARLERTGALPPAEAVALVAQAADALGAAHEAGIVHRDVKTANLMIDARGRVRVLDFGLSKRLGTSQAPAPPDDPIDPVAATVAPTSQPGDGWGLATDRTLPATPTPSLRGGGSSRDPVTAFGSRMGTPGYAAPELIAGVEADARSDVFSLGVVLYELVAGARPFPAETWGELERAMRAGPAPLSQASKGAVGPAFDAAVARALAPRRAARFATVGELIEAARAALTPARPPRLRRAWLYAGGAAIAVAGGAAIVLASSGGATPRAEDPSPAPAPPPSALFAGTPRALTSLGGCAEGPVFADDHTVVFDLSRDGAVSVWAVGRDGRGARSLATGPGWQWRAAPGRTPGEVLYVRTDLTDDAKSEVVAIDAATGTEREHFQVDASSAAYADGAIYFAVKAGSEIRRRKAGRDESWLTLASDQAVQQFVMSPRGEKIAFTTDTEGAPLHLCTASPGAAPKCIGRHASGARPEFSRDGTAVYFGDSDGISRHDLASGKDELVLRDVRAVDGLGISPDGKSMAYSECLERVRLADVTKPDAFLVDDLHPATPVFGPAGELAWVHQELGGNRLMMRRKDGTIVELVPPTFGRITGLAFDAAGARVAFVAGGAHPGVHVVPLRTAATEAAIIQLTDGATDYAPQFTRDGRVVFTRVDDRNVSHVYAVPADGGVAKPTSPGSRVIDAINPATGEVMITSGPHTWWWNPVTDRTREVTGSLPDGSIRHVSVSPHGRWILMQSGAAGLTFWRSPATEPYAFEKVVSLPTDWSADEATIDDDGHIVAPVSRWSGELKIVDAAPGVTL